MSTIDSGLGWSCDSDYYTATAGQALWSGGYTKANATPAVGGVLKYGDQWSNTYAGVLMSTDRDALKYKYAGQTGDMYVGTYTDSDGIVWYVGWMNNKQTATGGLAQFGTRFAVSYSSFTATNVAEFIIRNANVQPTAKKIPTTDYVKAFVEGVEAETAERVNALQPKTMSSAVSVGGVSQSTVESAIGAMATKISKIDFDISRNLGTEITAAQKVAIANGTFEDLPIGAFWTLNGTIYRIAHHDYYLGTGDTACTSHHIVIVPDNNMYSAVMNNTNTTEGGYAGSKMRTENLANASATFKTDFGAAHILNHRIIITTAVSNSQPSGWAWFSSDVDLMSENMVYGHPVCAPTRFETGIERGQLALFSLYPEFIQKQKEWYWLRSISSNSECCGVREQGHASIIEASYSAGVRPYTCIYFDDVL